MRILNFLIAIAFLISAAISVNASQPAIWILIYGSMAVIAILAMFELYFKAVIAGLFLVLLVFSFYFLDSFILWVDQPNLKSLFDKGAASMDGFITETRRYISLKISEVILVFYFVQSLRRSKPQKV